MVKITKKEESLLLYKLLVEEYSSRIGGQNKEMQEKSIKD